MKMYYVDEDEIWILEDSLNYRALAPIVLLDGTIPPYPLRYSARAVNTRVLEQCFLNKMPATLYTSFKNKGIDEFGVSFIINPQGNVEEVYFRFHNYQPQFTTNELYYWQLVSDELKRLMKFTFHPHAVGAKFYNMGRSISFTELQNWNN